MSVLDRQDQLDPTTVQVLDALVEALGEDLRVAIPAKVSKVEQTNPPRITAVPLIQRQGVGSKDPGIKGVPIATMRSGKVAVSLPISVGDPVWLMVSDRELDGWISKGGKSAAQAEDPRTHDLVDCVAYPADISSLPTGAAGNAWFGGSTVTTIIEGSAIKLGRLATQKVLHGTLFNFAHDIMLTAVAAGFTGLAAFFGSVVSATSALPAPAPVAALEVWARAVGKAAGIAQPLCTAAARAITVAFLPAQSTWLSTKVSTE